MADVELGDGRAFVRGAPARGVTLGEVVRAMSASGRSMQVLDKYDAPSAPTIDPRTGQGKPFNDYTFGTRNPHLLDYKIPTTLDSPAVEAILIESGNGLGPFGAKGIGEPAMTPTPAAIMNAVARAIGKPVTEFPITAERVRARLAELAASRRADDGSGR